MNMDGAIDGHQRGALARDPTVLEENIRDRCQF